MKFLDSFIDEISGVEKERFCSFYNCPFLLSKSDEDRDREDESPEEEIEEDFQTEILDFGSSLKFDTDEISIEEVLKESHHPDELMIIPLRKKGVSSEKQMITVGRTQNNDVCLPFKGISKFHAYFLVKKDSTQVVDGGSTNGTFLNGKMLVANRKYPVKSLDTVSFAKLFHYFFFTPDRLYDYLKFKKMM